ncbi:hypothetical protein [Arsukibacterium sp.]|uniref:hypothetical protein n=1 Tax=Arsukibacterium sp. TaxID=1977258 RepID=UPI002FD9D8D8
MNYSDWLKSTYPHLASESDVKVYNFVKQAKEQTSTSRRLVFLLIMMLVGLIGYTIGYAFARFTEVGFVMLAIITMLLGLLLFYVSTRIEQRLIKQKLTALLSQYQP